MAEFKFPCPRCGQHIQCDTGYAGMQINCPVCKQPIVVPQPPRAASAVQPPVRAKSLTLRNVLFVITAVLVLTGLVIGGWFGCSKIRIHKFMKEGLIAYYPLNGNANDASGNKNDGRVVGASPCKDRFGKANSAFSFNGMDNYISFESVPLKKLDNCSLSAWINPASIDQDSMAVCMGYDDGRIGNGFEFGISGGDRHGSQLYGILGGVVWIDSGYAFPQPNAWYYIVMLRTGGVTKFYVNGIQTANTESRTPSVPKAFTIGSATGIRFFNGMIDDVRIYNRAISGYEIREDYEAGNAN
jgi:DNA-directed RNA polymerase subunit RPC12/RpoP